MKRGIVAAFGLVLASSGAAYANADAQLCVTAISAPREALNEIVEACTRVLPIAASSKDKQLFLRYRGWALEAKGSALAAVADFDGALALAPNDTWSLQGRARAHKSLGQVDQARADYLRLEELNPDTRWRVALDELGTFVAPRPPVPAKAAEEAPVQVATRSTSPDEGDGAAVTDPMAIQEDLVRQIQVGLRELGYYGGTINGRVGTPTRQAMDAFADEKGLEPWDEPDEQLFAAIQDAVRERRAAQRELNARAQRSLAELGYDVGGVDGVWGARSQRALADWYASLGEPARDGIDPDVVARLEETAATGSSRPITVEDFAPLVAARPESAPQASEQPAPVAEAAPPKAAPAAPMAVATPQKAAPAPAPAPAPVADPPKAVAKVEPPPAQPWLEDPFADGGAGSEPIGRRVALVIGNSEYEHANPLVNPGRDAEGIADALEDIGFDNVIRGIDLTVTEMDELLEEFADEAEAADLAVVYYAGHGFQHGGKNYIVPVDAQVKTERTLRRLPRLDELISDASQAERLALVFVDACRDNPFGRLARSLGPSRSGNTNFSDNGWAPPSQIPPQTLISYATAAGTVAYDGNGTNSPYATALIRHLKTPGLEVQMLVRKVQDEVKDLTDGMQMPDSYNSLGSEEIFLVAPEAKPSGLELASLEPSERKSVQRSLKLIGWWEGPVDGQASDWLVDTVRSYQRSLGQPATGLLTPADMLALYRKATMSQPREPLPDLGGMASFLRRLREAQPEALRLAGMIADPAFQVLSEDWPKDPKEAAIYYRDAAERGDMIAMTRLGMLLTRPNESPDNQATGRTWLERAADRGDPQASLRLAQLLMSGPTSSGGTGRERAKELLKVAAASPDTDGIALIQLRELDSVEVR